MRNKLNSFLCLSSILLPVFMGTLAAPAQTEVQPVPPVQQESPDEPVPASRELSAKKRTAGFFRFWNFIPEKKGHVSAVLVNSSGEEIIFGRYMRASRTSDYKRLPLGKYKLIVRADNDPTGLEKLSAPPLFAPLDLEIKDQTWQTGAIQLLPTTGVPSVAILADIPSKKGEVRIRALNFTTDQKPMLSVTSAGKETILWSEITTPVERPLPMNIGTVSFNLSHKLPNGNIRVQPLEVDVKDGDFSLLIFYDRYNQLIFKYVADSVYIPEEKPVPTPK